MEKIKEQNRRSGFKKRLPVVFIICEGEGTEIIYFKRFRARNNNLEIHPIVSPQKSAYHLVSNTRKLLEQENYSPEDGDQVGCVFDRNGNSNDELTRAEQLAIKRNYKVAFSNPAFEIWYLLHFFAKYSAMNDADAVIKALDCKNALLNYKKRRIIMIY